MSEEDINIIENFLNYNKEYLSVIEIASISKLLKAYRKQQKEIVRLNRKQADDEMLTDTFIERDYISKDKIREKIKELKNIIEFERPTYEDYLKYTIDILEGLLEER